MSECKDKPACSSRREFLVKAGLVAGGMLLTVSAPASLLAANFEDVTIDVGADSPLAKDGGYQIVDSSAGKIIVINESGKFVAFSARCTHKGVIVKYDAAAKTIKCPAHGSKFDGETGAVTDGPANSPLKSYPAATNAGKVTVSVS